MNVYVCVCVCVCTRYVWVTAERKNSSKYTLLIKEPVSQRVLENSVQVL